MNTVVQCPQISGLWFVTIPTYADDDINHVGGSNQDERIVETLERR
jgi:hypothetical protein